MSRIQYLYPFLGILSVGIAFYPTLQHDAIYWTGGKNLSNLPTIPWLGLVLHLLNVLVVYFFVNIAFKKPLIAAATMILWGLHPLHADSVAWTIRQNTLSHTILYVLSLLCYILYLRASSPQKRGIWYALSAVVFFGATFFQRIALVIPLVFFLLDYFEGRERVKNQWWVDKLLFWGLAVLSWFVSLNASAPDYAEEVPVSFLQKVGLGGYALGVYVSKFFAPFNITLINPSSLDKSITNLGIGIGFATFAFVAFFVLRKKIPFHKELSLGLLFFLLHLLPSLVLPIDGYILWLAYKTYLAYLGLVIAMVYLCQWLLGNKTVALQWAMVIVIACVFGYLAWQRANDWKSTKILIEQVMAKHPRYQVPYFLRGNIYLREKEYQKAQSDFETVNSLRPDIMSTFLLGHIFHKLKDFKTSVVAYDKVVSAQPALANTFRYCIDMGLNKANLYDPTAANQLLGKAETFANTPELKAESHLSYGIYNSIYNFHKEAKDRYREAIKYNPQLTDAYTNLGTLTLLYDKNPDGAIEYLKRAEMLAPKDTVILGNLANCYLKKKDTLTANYYAQRYSQLVVKKK